MSQTIVFRGASVRYFDVRQGKEGGDVFVRIHASSQWNEQVRDNMEWEAIPDSVTDCKLTGELLASHMILTPGDPELAKNYELQFDITSVEDFRLVALKDDEGEMRRRELRFIIRTPEEAEEFLGKYLRRVGRHEGALKIAYTKQEEMNFQEAASSNSPSNEGRKEEAPMSASDVADEIVKQSDLETFGPEDSTCVSCANRLPYEDPPANTMHCNGVRCSRKLENATLASAAAVGTGTHQRRKRKGLELPEAEDDGVMVTQ